MSRGPRAVNLLPPMRLTHSKLGPNMLAFHLSFWRLTPLDLFACYFAENVPRLQPEHVLPIPKAPKNIIISSKSDPKSSKNSGFPLVLQSDTDWSFFLPLRAVLRKICKWIRRAAPRKHSTMNMCVLCGAPPANTPLPQQPCRNRSAARARRPPRSGTG